MMEAILITLITAIALITLMTLSALLYSMMEAIGPDLFCHGDKSVALLMTPNDS